MSDWAEPSLTVIKKIVQMRHNPGIEVWVVVCWSVQKNKVARPTWFSSQCFMGVFNINKHHILMK